MFGFSDNDTGKDLSTEVRGRRAFKVLLLGIGLLTLTFAGAWYTQYANSLAEKQADSRLQEQTHLFELLNELQQAESAQRGYLVTNNRQYLLPYNSAREEIPLLLNWLDRKATEGKIPAEQVDRVQSLANRKMTELGQTIALKDSGREADAIALVNQDIGQIFMDSIRLEMADLRLNNLQAYQSNIAVVQRTSSIIFVLELLSMIILVFILYYVNAVIQSQFLKTQADNDKLKKQQENLRDKNDQLERFAYIASHDLNEPLRTISSFVDVFYEDQGDKLDPEGKKYLKFIHEAADRMRGLIEGLLNFSRIGRSGEQTKINLDKLVQEIKQDLAIKFKQRSVKFESDDLPEIRGYRTEIRQLFQNLILNAVKFSRGAPNIKVSCQDRTSHWEFCVRDNGIGIATIHQERIFGMFSKLHRSNDYPGQGIGLAFCKRIVELHGGKIWLDSTPGQGSKFYFTIAKEYSHVTPNKKHSID